MQFCPKCGAILIKKRTNFGCPKCNYVTKDKVNLVIKEEVKERKPVAVVHGKEGEVDPVTTFKCEKCKNTKAYFWVQQMRAGDEPESKFFKCTKCKNVVRVDD